MQFQAIIMDDKIEIFIEDGEELPTDVKKKIKVLEMSVFDQNDKRRIESMLEKIENLSYDSSILADVRDVASRIDSSAQKISGSEMGIRDSITKLSVSIKTNDARLDHVLELLEDDKDRELLAKIASSLRAQESILGKISKVLDDESGLETVRNMSGKLSQLAEYVQASERMTERLIDVIEKGGGGKEDAIGALAEAVAANESRVSSFLAMLLDMIEAMKGRFSSMDGEFLRLNDSVNSLSGQINGAVSRMQDSSDSLSAKMDFLEGNSLGARDSMDSASFKLSALSDDMAAVRDSLDTVSLGLNSLSQANYGMKDSVESMPTRIVALDERMAEIKSAIDLIDMSSSNEVRDALDEIRQSMNGELKESVDSLSKKISSLDGNVLSIKESMNFLYANANASMPKDPVDGLSTKISALEDSLGYVEESVGNLSWHDSSLGDSIKGIKDSIEILSSSLSTARMQSEENASDLLAQALSERMNTSFDVLNEKIDRMDVHLAGMHMGDGMLGGKIDHLDAKIGEMNGVMAESLASMKQDETRLVSFIDRTLDSVEDTRKYVDASQKSFQDFAGKIADIESNVDARLNDIDAGMNYVKGALVTAKDGMEASSESMEGKLSASVESVNEKIDAHTSIVNNRLENMALQIVEPINDISLRLNDISTKIKNMKSDNPAISPTEIRKLESAVKKFSADVEEVKKGEVKMLLDEMGKINTRLSRLDDSEFLVRIMDARKFASRMPKADRRRINQSILVIENELLDAAIITLVRKKKMNIALISKSLDIGQQRVRERIKVLVQSKRIKAERLGRYTVYTA